MPSSAYNMRMFLPGKVRFFWNQAIPWHHFPIEQPIVMNSVHLKRDSTGTPIVVASEDFGGTVYFESNEDAVRVRTDKANFDISLISLIFSMNINHYIP